MNDIQLNVFKDELSIKTWLLVGAGVQAVVTLLLPKYVAILPTLLVLLGQFVLFSMTKTGVRRNDRKADIHYGIRGARVPQAAIPMTPSPSTNPGNLPSPKQQQDGAASPRDEQVVLFILGARSTSASGRRTAQAKRVGAALGEIVAEAERAREKYGFLGRSAPLMGTEAAQGNTLVTLTYWRSVEGLMAFARESAAHRGAWSWVAEELTTPSSSEDGRSGREDRGDGGSLRDVGIFHELYFCPESQARRYYINYRPFGFAQTKFVVEDHRTGEKMLAGPTMVDKKVRWPPPMPVLRSKSEGSYGYAS